MSKKKKAVAVEAAAVAENGAAVEAAAMGEGHDDLLMAYLAAKVEARRQQQQKDALIGAIQTLDRRKAEKRAKLFSYLQGLILALACLYCCVSVIACVVADLWPAAFGPLVLLWLLIRKAWPK